MSATRTLPLSSLALILPALAVCDARRPEPSEDARETAVADTLAVDLETPGEVSAGETVRMTIRLRNTADRPIALHLLGREIAFDLVVRDADGAVVWERLAGETVMAILRLETLDPGESLDLEGTWDQRTSEGAPVPPGAYSVQGSVPTDGEPLLTPAVALRIASPG